MSWHGRFEAKFGSNRSEAARRLHAAWKKVAPRDARRVHQRSLANRIGTLLKEGDRTGWWGRRAKLAQLFADLLDLEREDIFGAPPSHAGLTFPEFPRLPPLGPGEEPCRVTREGSLLHIVAGLLGNDRSRRAWIVAPPGSGKSLVVRCLQARHPGEVAAATVHTLSAVAAEAATGLPLVVEIEEVEPGADLHALGPLAARLAPTVILAPFPFPESAWYGAGSRVGFSESGWTTMDATPSGSWRERMLDWIDARLEAADRDTKLIKSDVLDWLLRHDPSGRLVATPGDLLALCSEFDLHGGGIDDLHERAGRWLDDVAPAMFPTEVPTTWRKHAAARTYRSLAEEHLRGVGRAFGTLDSEIWSSLVPADVLPAAAGERPGSTLVVGYLREAGLLRGSRLGLVLYPTWVAHAVATAGLLPELGGANLRTFGAVAADETRQRVADDALDGLSDGALLALLRALAKQRGPNDLAGLASIETTLAALGRRLLRTGFRLEGRDALAAQQLMMLQVDALITKPGYGQVHHPFTRREVDEWFATAWAVSLSVPPPAGYSRPDLAWELPGWAQRLSLSDVPQHGFPWSTISPWGATASVQRVAALAPSVVEKLEPGDVPEKVPRLLLPALFLSSAEWKLGKGHLEMLAGSWEERLLGDAASGLDAGSGTSIADRIWNLVAQSVVPDGAVPVAERLHFLRQRHPGLAEFVTGNVSSSEVARTAKAHGVHRRGQSPGSYVPSDPLELLALPRDVRQAALRAWLEGAGARGARFDEARELVPLLDREDVDLALDLARAGDRSVAAEFTSFVWRTAPGRAREEARLALERDLPSVEGWFHQAPRTQLPFLMDLVSGFPTPPNWIGKWAMRRVLDGGQVAEQLFRLAAPTTS